MRETSCRSSSEYTADVLLMAPEFFETGLHKNATSWRKRDRGDRSETHQMVDADALQPYSVMWAESQSFLALCTCRVE